MLYQLNKESGGIRWQAVRQVFNWIARRGESGIEFDDDTSPEGQHELRMVMSAQKNPPPARVVWVCKLNGDDLLSARLDWNPKLFSEEQALTYVCSIHRIVGWICDSRNGERRVDEIRQALQPETLDVEEKETTLNV